MAEKNENFYFPKYTYNKISLAYLPTTAYVSLSQDGISICKAYVHEGDTVYEGQLIASNSKTGINIHSPIPGKVHAIEAYPMPNGENVECIVIKMGGNFTSTGKETKVRSWKYDTSSRIVSQFKQQGIIKKSDTKIG